MTTITITTEFTCFIGRDWKTRVKSIPLVVVVRYTFSPHRFLLVGTIISLLKTQGRERLHKSFYRGRTRNSLAFHARL